MFIKTTRSGYNDDGEQICHGLFLWVFGDPSGGRELRAVVRHIRMRQCGHWMMASAELAGFRMSLSGSYGSDGLPDDLGSYFPKGQNESVQMTEAQKKAVWEQLVVIPDELRDKFWAGGGHNSAGSEGPSMREWALANLKELRKTIKKVA